MERVVNSTERSIRVFCIDDDLVFRLGLGAALDPFSDLQLVGQSTVAAAIAQLALALTAERLPNVIVLDPGADSGPEVCRTLLQSYPALPILLLVGGEPPSWLSVVRELGVAGYRTKGTPLPELAAVLRRLAAGERDWSPVALPGRVAGGNWLQRQRQEAMETIAASLQDLDLSPRAIAQMNLWAWLVWSGRRRELQAARWVVRQLLPVETVVTQEPTAALATAGPATVVAAAATPTASLAQAAIAATRLQLQGGIANSTTWPLAFDILQTQPRQELLYAALAEFETLLAELQFLQTSLEQLPEERPQLLRQLWQQTLLRFFGKYYSPASTADLLDNIVSEATTTQTALLARIPLVTELLAYCLYEEPLEIENVPYRAESPEARTRAAVLLGNLTLAIADAVMQALLNAFSDAPSFRSGRLLQQQYLATRELDRFRNSLSFRYIQDELFAEPKAIYEDRHRLLSVREGRIKGIAIYAPRRLERSQLRGIRAGVRLGLEVFDAVSPRLQAVIAWLGSGVVYVLREVIGRGLGLIGSGIIQGVSSALQETRYGKNLDRKE